MELIKVIITANESEYPNVNEKLEQGYEIVGMNPIGSFVEVFLVGKLVESTTSPILENPFEPVEEPSDETVEESTPEELEPEPNPADEAGPDTAEGQAGEAGGETAPVDRVPDEPQPGEDSAEVLEESNPEAPTEVTDPAGPAPEPTDELPPATAGPTDETVPEFSENAPSTQPYDGPYAEMLKEGGFLTRADIASATDEALIDIDGIGPIRLQEIRDYLSLTA